MTTLPPLGCLPAAITVFGSDSNECVAKLNTEAVSFNNKLNATSQRLQTKLPNLKLVVFDIYQSLYSLVTKPADSGTSSFLLYLKKLIVQFAGKALIVEAMFEQVLQKQEKLVVEPDCWKHQYCAIPNPLGHAQMHLNMFSGMDSTHQKLIKHLLIG